MTVSGGRMIDANTLSLNGIREMSRGTDRPSSSSRSMIPAVTGSGTAAMIPVAPLWTSRLCEFPARVLVDLVVLDDDLTGAGHPVRGDRLPECLTALAPGPHQVGMPRDPDRAMAERV